MRVGEEENTLSPWKLWGAAPNQILRDPRAWRSRGEAPTRPRFPSLSRGRTGPGPSPSGGQGLMASSRGESPIFHSLQPLRWGQFPYKGPAGEVRFRAGNFLPIRCWKTKGFCAADTSGRGVNVFPPIFINEITPNISKTPWVSLRVCVFRC